MKGCGMKETVSIQAVKACMAQTKCTQCGYNGCGPYAKAIVEAGEAINKCRPGGERVVKKLADLLGVEAIPPAQEAYPPAIAVVQEDLCIGCTKCLQVCPTDAILGAPKMKHQVLAEDCTGCRLCLPVCPTECITLTPTRPPADEEQRQVEIAALIAAKKQRKDGDLLRNIAELGEKQTTELPRLTLDETVQAKLAQARAQASQKWTEKKTPATPKMLAEHVQKAYQKEDT